MKVRWNLESDRLELCLLSTQPIWVKKKCHQLLGCFFSFIRNFKECSVVNNPRQDRLDTLISVERQ
jgi:hypothetical protein